MGAYRYSKTAIGSLFVIDACALVLLLALVGSLIAAAGCPNAMKRKIGGVVFRARRVVARRAAGESHIERTERRLVRSCRGGDRGCGIHIEFGFRGAPRVFWEARRLECLPCWSLSHAPRFH